MAAGTTIVTLQALDPIYADVDCRNRAIGQVKIGQSVQGHTQTATGRNFTGEVTAINPKADPNSRMIQLRIKRAKSGRPVAARHVRHREHRHAARRSRA